MRTNQYTPLTWKQLKTIRLFSHGNRCRKARDHVRAYIIFDWLLSRQPDNAEYGSFLQQCRRAVLRLNKNLIESPRLFTTSRHSTESIDARLLSILIPLIDDDCLDHLAELIGCIQSPHLRIPLEINLEARLKRLSEWAMRMNAYMEVYDLGNCKLHRHETPWSQSQESHILQTIRFESTGSTSERSWPEPTVSILMSAFNAEPTINYAIRSVLEQDYSDFELIIVDDASTDGTASIIAAWASKDSRVVPVHGKMNRGPYACRNVALDMARGSLITTHDADDFCHPYRLQQQVNWLQAHPETMAVLSQWLRVTQEGQLLYHNKRGGDFLHGGLATMMYRRQVLDAIGYYDQVRYSADTEYLYRLRAVYGVDAVSILRKPLVLAASTSTSLTAVHSSYTDSFLGDCTTRHQYRLAWEQWHEQAKPNLYMPSEPVMRPFAAPPEMHA